MSRETVTKKAVLREATTIESARGTLIAHLMDVGTEWGPRCLDAPGWWVDRWARRLVADVLDGAAAGEPAAEVAAEVSAWLDEVVDTLSELTDLAGEWSAAAGREVLAGRCVRRARDVVAAGRREQPTVPAETDGAPPNVTNAAPLKKR